MSINIGIPQDKREKICEQLSVLLADTYTLYLKTHNFHWNVTGSMFRSLHKMFEEEYMELAAAVDLIAERIRALGLYAPASYKEFTKLTSIKEADKVPNAYEMIHQLVEGHETVIHTARKGLEIADSAHDEASVEMLTQRIQTHEKTAWMLRSIIQE